VLLMARSARLFLCGRCRVQVLLCSHCDRGQHYCSRECSGQARRERRREAAERYQRSWRGRLAHAERSRRWRARQATGLVDDAPQSANKIVTHQGCPAPVAAASLAPCASPRAHDAATAALFMPDKQQSWQCRRCQHPLLSHLRRDFLRRGRGREHFP
jgi:hypothetical protein